MFNVGDKVTIVLWSDRYPATVVAATGKRVTVRRNRWTRGPWLTQDHTVHPELEGGEARYSLRKSGRWVTVGQADKYGSVTLMAGHHPRYDWEF